MQISREILFRAKRTGNEKWMEGYYFHNPNIDRHFIHTWLSGGLVEIDPTTLSQFTGMYDKNRKRIFENDIVKTQYGRLCVVKWYSSDSYCGWDLDPINTSDNLRLKPPSECFLWSKEDNEIVGNLFDNYDLIKEVLK